MEENKYLIDHEIIDSIENLENCIRTLIPISITALGYEDYEITDIEFEDMVNQVIVTILFDKYVKEEEFLSSFKYSKELYKIISAMEIQSENDDSDDLEDLENNGIKSINEKTLRFIRNYNDSENKKDEWHLEIINGINKEKEQHKLLWDFCYINSTMITAKQYRRTLTKKSGNNSYENIIQELENTILL